MHQQNKDYKLAIVCFKKMLHLAYMENNTYEEIRAYECLALQHFYLQDLKRA